MPADRLGAEPRTGPERGAAVPRHAEDGGFDIRERLDMGQAGVGRGPVNLGASRASQGSYMNPPGLQLAGFRGQAIQC